MKIIQTTQDWGNSTGIRLPKKVLDTVKWQHNQSVAINVKDSSIILSPLKTKGDKLSLNDLVTKITPENIHSEVDWGEPTGSEIW